MKAYARRNKRKQLNVKYRWRGMAKSNTRKHNRRRKFTQVKLLLDKQEIACNNGI
jgi:hypothetical protein